LETTDQINLKEIDNLIHEPARLGILVLLLSHSQLGLQFNDIQNALGLSPGNLSSHAQKLAKAEYVMISKMFVELKPRTWLKITPKGAEALKSYAVNLEKVLETITS
jgi:DNA-binding MarR family transcriptional regulator